MERLPLPFRQSLRREAIRSGLGILFDIDIPKPDLEETKKLLKNGANLVLYFNHLTFADPVIVSFFDMKYIDPEGKRKLVVPASHWHTRFEKSKLFTTAAKAAQIVLGAEILRIVQDYQIDNPDFGYSEKDARKTYRNLFERVTELREKNVPTTVVIAPEGHRSETGELGQAGKGVITIGNILAPVVYLPLAIFYPEGYERSGLNTRGIRKKKRIRLVTGQPYFQEFKIDKKDFENLKGKLMDNLKDALDS